MELISDGVPADVERGPRVAGQLRRLLPVRRLLLHVLCPLRLSPAHVMSKVGLITLSISLREFINGDLRISRLIFHLTLLFILDRRQEVNSLINC